jgi:hypothetical protein
LHRALRRLDHGACVRGLGQWFAAQGRPPEEARALDGTTRRGIHVAELPGVHLVAASAHQTRIVLAEAATRGQGHALAGVHAARPARPGRLLSGRVITGDARLATRAVCRPRVRKGGPRASSCRSIHR